MSAAVNMLSTVFLSTLLMLGGLGGAAASDLQLHGKSVLGDKTLLSGEDGRHTVRKHPHLQTNNEIRRSLDLKSFNIHVNPTTSKISIPTFIKLHPPTANPLHLHANMPMRFGRESSAGEERAPNSTPNMPQRFGRSWEAFQPSAKCPAVHEALRLPQKHGRRSRYWSLLRTLANAQLVDSGLHWDEDVDFTVSSEEMQEKEFKGRT